LQSDKYTYKTGKIHHFVVLSPGLGDDWHSAFDLCSGTIGVVGGAGGGRATSLVSRLVDRRANCKLRASYVTVKRLEMLQ